MSRTSHRDYTDEEFVIELNDCVFPPELFNHEAHLRLSYILLSRLSKEEAKIKIVDSLVSYVTSLGAKDKFHATLSHAGIEIIDDFLSQSKATNFDQLLEYEPNLKGDFLSLIHKHYSPKRLKQAEAAKEYISPDRLPFS